MTKMRIAAAFLALTLVSSCDRAPIDATAALPTIGAQLPKFDVPSYTDSTRLSTASIRGAPALVALWSVHCPFQGPAMAGFDSLRQAYGDRGVQFVLLADDARGAELDSTLRAASWWDATVRTGVADGRLVVADEVEVLAGRLTALFDRSRDVESAARVEFVLPSFLLVDADGRVVQRAFGTAGDFFRPALDSLIRAASPPA